MLEGNKTIGVCNEIQKQCNERNELLLHKLMVMKGNRWISYIDAPMLKVPEMPYKVLNMSYFES